MIVFIWALMSIGIGAIAANNGRSFIGLAALAMIISPLLGLIAVLAAGKAGGLDCSR